MTKRKEISVKNNPGISKLLEWNPKNEKWVESGKFRATRRVKTNGISKKESACFDNIEDAKSFRLGKLNKEDSGEHHKNAPKIEDNRMRFPQLLQNWKNFHFEKVDLATQQTYERKIPALESFLSEVAVEDIDASMIDKMIKYWKSEEFKKGKNRQSFEKELDALKVILNFYRKRQDPRYPIQIYHEHYVASRTKTFIQKTVKTLKKNDLSKFFEALKTQINPMYFPMALTQFGLSLRIGEACGLFWEDFDLEAMTVNIRRTVVWDHDTHEPRFKDCPKNGKERGLAIPETLGAILIKHKKDSLQDTGLVFHKPDGTAFIRKSVANAYNRALKICNINYVTGTHLLRKSAATQANMLTGDFFAVSKNLGHSSVEVTKRYVEEVDESKRKVARALNEVMSQF